MRRVLLLSGTDPSGGAGIAADLATVTAHRLKAMPVITAVVAQNTTAVSDSLVIPPTLVEQQLHAALAEYRPDAVKIGMVPTLEMATVIATTIAIHRLPCVVLDPVLVSSSGTPLVDLLHKSEIFARLAAVATLVTPNLPEAALIADVPAVISSPPEMRALATSLADTYRVAFLLKGGHLPGNRLDDLLVSPHQKPRWFPGRRIRTSAGAARGTGCRLSTAIASYLAHGASIPDAVFLARLALRHDLLAES